MRRIYCVALLEFSCVACHDTRRGDILCCCRVQNLASYRSLGTWTRYRQAVLLYLGSYGRGICRDRRCVVLFHVALQRAKNNPDPIKYTHGSHTLEIVWTIIPAATLLFIAIYQFNSWAQTKMRNPIYGPDGVQGVNEVTGINDDMAPTVEVTARRWEWRIRYPGKDGILGTPDDLFTVNDLHVPANKDTVVLLKSNDILHSFFLPNMRVKQDAVPGMQIPVWFKPIKEPFERNYTVDIVAPNIAAHGTMP